MKIKDPTCSKIDSLEQTQTPIFIFENQKRPKSRKSYSHHFHYEVFNPEKIRGAAAKVQGWESVFWGVPGIPLLEKIVVSWFLVSWLLVSWFQSFLVFWCQRFKNPLMFLRFGPYYQIPISCFLIDIDFIEISFDGSSGFSGPPFFPKSLKNGLPTFWDGGFPILC